MTGKISDLSHISHNPLSAEASEISLYNTLVMNDTTAAVVEKKSDESLMIFIAEAVGQSEDVF